MTVPSRIAILLIAVLLLTSSPAEADEVIFKNGDRLTGTVTRVGDGKIVVETATIGTVTAKLADVQSFTAKAGVAQATQPASRPTTVAAAPAPAPVKAEPPKPAEKRWSGSVTAGAIVTRGNSNTETFRAGIEAVRKDKANTLSLKAGYAFGQQEDRATGDENTTTDNWFGQARLDHNLSERLYEYALIRVEQDRVAELDLRLSPGVGAGYRWVKSATTNFNTEAGVAWVYEQYSNNRSNQHLAVRFAYHFDKKLNDKVSLVHNVEYLPNVVDWSDYILNVDAGVRAMLTASMFAEFKAEWRRDSTPAAAAHDDDLRYTIGVGWKF
jgi:putative salt-induced outer membrane protein YdiY